MDDDWHSNLQDWKRTRKSQSSYQRVEDLEVPEEPRKAKSKTFKEMVEERQRRKSAHEVSSYDDYAGGSFEFEPSKTRTVSNGNLNRPDDETADEPEHKSSFELTSTPLKGTKKDDLDSFVNQIDEIRKETAPLTHNDPLASGKKSHEIGNSFSHDVLKIEAKTDNFAARDGKKSGNFSNNREKFETGNSTSTPPKSVNEVKHRPTGGANVADRMKMWNKSTDVVAPSTKAAEHKKASHVNNSSNMFFEKIIRINQRPNHEKGFGFTISGGRELNAPIVVDKVVRGGSADICELKAGDEIMTINGADVGRHYGDSVQTVLDQAIATGTIELKIKRLRNFDDDFEEEVFSDDEMKLVVNKRASQISDSMSSQWSSPPASPPTLPSVADCSDDFLPPPPLPSVPPPPPNWNTFPGATTPRVDDSSERDAPLAPMIGGSFEVKTKESRMAVLEKESREIPDVSKEDILRRKSQFLGLKLEESEEFKALQEEKEKKLKYGQMGSLDFAGSFSAPPHHLPAAPSPPPPPPPHPPSQPHHLLPERKPAPVVKSFLAQMEDDREKEKLKEKEEQLRKKEELMRKEEDRLRREKDRIELESEARLAFEKERLRREKEKELEQERERLSKEKDEELRQERERLRREKEVENQRQNDDRIRQEIERLEKEKDRQLIMERERLKKEKDEEIRREKEQLKAERERQMKEKEDEIRREKEQFQAERERQMKEQEKRLRLDQENRERQMKEQEERLRLDRENRERQMKEQEERLRLDRKNREHQMKEQEERLRLDQENRRAEQRKLSASYSDDRSKGLTTDFEPSVRKPYADPSEAEVAEYSARYGGKTFARLAAHTRSESLGEPGIQRVPPKTSTGYFATTDSLLNKPVVGNKFDKPDVSAKFSSVRSNFEHNNVSNSSSEPKSSSWNRPDRSQVGAHDHFEDVVRHDNQRRPSTGVSLASEEPPQVNLRTTSLAPSYGEHDSFTRPPMQRQSASFGVHTVDPPHSQRLGSPTKNNQATFSGQSLSPRINDRTSSLQPHFGEPSDRERAFTLDRYSQKPVEQVTSTRPQSREHPSSVEYPLRGQPFSHKTTRIDQNADAYSSGQPALSNVDFLLYGIRSETAEKNPDSIGSGGYNSLIFNNAIPNSSSLPSFSESSRYPHENGQSEKQGKFSSNTPQSAHQFNESWPSGGSSVPPQYSRNADSVEANQRKSKTLGPRPFEASWKQPSSFSSDHWMVEEAERRRIAERTGEPRAWSMGQDGNRPVGSSLNPPSGFSNDTLPNRGYSDHGSMPPYGSYPRKSVGEFHPPKSPRSVPEPAKQTLISRINTASNKKPLSPLGPLPSYPLNHSQAPPSHYRSVSSPIADPNQYPGFERSYPAVATHSTASPAYPSSGGAVDSLFAYHQSFPSGSNLVSQQSLSRSQGSLHLDGTPQYADVRSYRFQAPYSGDAEPRSNSYTVVVKDQGVSANSFPQHCQPVVQNLVCSGCHRPLTQATGMVSLNGGDLRIRCNKCYHENEVKYSKM